MSDVSHHCLRMSGLSEIRKPCPAESGKPADQNLQFSFLPISGKFIGQTVIINP